ncbi:MAG: alpha/beta hydrolase [Acidobacteria bacterium]|nr:alpha/beta hydrolase [Acidobacteriota bacterium]
MSSIRLEPIRYDYGADASQYAQLFLPTERLRQPGVVVVIHGGYWRAQYDASLGVPLAEALAQRGVPTWNLEYRRAGNGGGWPSTFVDVAAGIDALTLAAAEHGLNLDAVVGLGHSAGGQLAVWAAGRDQPAVALTAVVSQAGVLNLGLARELRLSNDAVVNWLGPDRVDRDDDGGSAGNTGGSDAGHVGNSKGGRSRYALADPMTALPLCVPVFALHSEQDEAVPVELSQSYVEASQWAVSQHAPFAEKQGVPATFVSVPGGHMDLIDPATPAGQRSLELAISTLVNRTANTAATTGD